MTQTLTQPETAKPQPAYAWVADAPHPPVSVVILTLNEEINIADCIASCGWCSDVHVLDSGSSDRTAEIARSLGAGVHVHSFESFGKQRNWAIDNIPLANNWVFHLDADERFTPELVREMDSILGASPPEAGYHVPSKLMFMGRWLRRVATYPTYQMRLFHRERMRFSDHGHGQREDTTGSVGKIVAPYLHYNFSKGIDDWLDKHNRYATLEAEQFLNSDAGETGLAVAVAGLFSAESVRRRRALKVISYRLPMRHHLVFLYLIALRLGFLDGRPGLTYARMRSIYEQMIGVKLSVLRYQRKDGRL